MATNVYVDGFNLYNGCVRHTDHKWLDLEAFFAQLLPAEDTAAIRYFTAHVSGKEDPGSPTRQRTFLRALETLPLVSVHFGKFKTRPVRMRNANPPPNTVEVIKREEKRSDVNLAAHMISDSAAGQIDTVVLVSNDSDFRDLLTMAKETYGMRVGVVNPHPEAKRSLELAAVADFTKQISAAVLASAQFPAQITFPGTKRKPINKPSSW